MSEGDMSNQEQEQGQFQPIGTPQEVIDKFRGPSSPTSHHEMPDIRMQLMDEDDIFSQFGVDAQIARQLGFSGERALEQAEEIIRQRIEFGTVAPEREKLIKAKTPEQVRWAMRSFNTEMIITSTEAPFYYDRYGALDMYRIARAKARVLREGLPDNREVMNYLGFEDLGIYTHEIVPKVEKPDLTITDDMDDSTKALRELENQIRAAFRIKNSQERAEAERLRKPLIEELDNECKIMIAMAKSSFLYDNYFSSGGDINTFARQFIVPMPYHMQAEDFKAKYSAGPQLMEREGKQLPESLRAKPEARHWGNDVDLGMRAYWLVGFSEKPNELLWYMSTPGFRDIFLAEVPEVQRQSWIEEWIGKPDEWKKEKRTLDDVEDENRRGLRGRLTKYGNTWTHKEDTETRESLREAVRELLLENESAENSAYWDFRVLGLAARLGSERYWDERNKQWIYDVEGFPGGSDDLTKLTVTGDWQMKDYMSGHPIGPDATVGKIERLLEDMFGFSTSKVEINEREVVRSVREQWWGYPAERGKPEEPARRLGEIDWDKFKPEVLRDLMLRVWFGGKEGGFLDDWRKTAWSPQELINIGTWRKLSKDLNIIVQPALIANGKLRDWDGKEEKLQDAVRQKKIQIKQLHWEGIKESPDNSWLWQMGSTGNKTTTGEAHVKEVQREAKYWEKY